MVDSTLYPTPLREESFPSKQPLQHAEFSDFWSEEKSEACKQWSLESVTALVQRLMKTGWKRLPCEDMDPLGMLFNQGVKQWTAGWDPRDLSLYSLIWTADSWKHQALWSLYQDGQLIFRSPDYPTSPLSRSLHQLLESTRLPHISLTDLMIPLVNGNYSKHQRQLACEKLQHTILACPEIWETLKMPFFKVLEGGLDERINDISTRELVPELGVSLLETLILNQLSSKNILVECFRQFLMAGLLKSRRDRRRLHDALSRLQDSFLNQGHGITAQEVQQLYWEHYRTFCNILNQENWQIRLAASL